MDSEEVICVTAYCHVTSRRHRCGILHVSVPSLVLFKFSVMNTQENVETRSYWITEKPDPVNVPSFERAARKLRNE